ncbi:MAG: hypothetical protein WCO30_02870 [bacterium]
MNTKQLVMNHCGSEIRGTFFKLVEQAVTGSIINLARGLELDSKSVYTDGAEFFPEFLYKNSAGVEVSLGRHYCDDYHGWNVRGEPLLFLFRDSGEFLRVETNGEEVSLGHHEGVGVGGWGLGATGPVFIRSNRHVVMVLSGGTERDLGSYDSDDGHLAKVWAGPYGSILFVEGRFYRLDIKGRKFPLPENWPTSGDWVAAAYGLVYYDGPAKLDYYIIK